MELMEYYWIIGIFVNSVFCLSHNEYIYVGCYGQVFKGCKPGGSITDMTVEKCDKSCTGYTYIAIFSGTICFCCNDDNFSVSSKTKASYCNTNCPGDSTTLCGGGISYTSVYTKHESDTVYTTTRNFVEVRTQIETHTTTILPSQIISTKIETQTTTILPSPLITTKTHVLPCAGVEMQSTLILPSFFISTTTYRLPCTEVETQTTAILPIPVSTPRALQCPTLTPLLCPTNTLIPDVPTMKLTINGTGPIVSISNADGQTILKSKACQYVIVVTDFSAQSSEAASSIAEQLIVPKTNVSAFIASKNSAPDHRLSAQAIGYSGILMFILPFTLIMWFDIISILKLRKLINRPTMGKDLQ